ncbi:hypothetical protein LTR36_007332 [Oleoguttula mirabilis]|uniref:Uncharacterized protein n=1 Tax=Oleoguttula mirabilis TaxID=1507867 RepID=A0AAV9JA78_9PEZI|nr:hypothetical protein LTR36_007332 [Oleoguttula mirabilis]
MSFASPATVSYEASETHDGPPPAAEPSPCGETAASGGIGRASVDAAEPIQRSDSKRRRKATHSAPKAAEGARQSSRKGKLKGGSSRGYRDLLNIIIGDARGQLAEDSEPLANSQIGASYWTSAEKDAFFTKLARTGPGDLRALSHAVESKSEAEVQVYLLLLQEGTIEAAATLPPHHTSTYEDIPAALEVGVDVETHLNLAAEALSRKLDSRDVAAEKEKHGGDWLIDEAHATQVEQKVQHFEAASETAQSEAQDGEAAASITSNGVEAPLFASAALLRPEAFLQLSRNVYMNGTAFSDQETWHNLVARADCDSTEPAIFRTAFDDLHNLAVSLTRRLVQATLFQTMSRLRASDGARANWQPKADVREMDVSAALNVLGMKADHVAYWAQLPRRCGLEVYSDAKEYRDGRSGTKNGVKLTYEEVEAELGMGSAEQPAMTRERGRDESVDESLDEADVDSDMFTLVSETDDASEAASDREGGSGGTDSASETVSEAESVHTKEEPPRSEDDERSDAGLARKHKRKRALSPASFGRAEDRYLEAHDQQAGREEEHRLWEEVLGRQPPEQGRFDMAESTVEPAPQPSASEITHWRDHVRHEAEWERFPEGVPTKRFAEMEELGRQGRRKRAHLRETLLSRCNGSMGPIGDFERVQSSDEG